ncbi:M48 family metalloprotease [Variovorax terrae]|uniref:M48 family metalloprotease n=1 Tax=Variovorax terrae TaxID=2923278 RepID=A0A9X2APT6_9BURK|nr:M48 family metalloprotease [Variovorax terrae]MCJ0765230.1 M48 family metalloprotease [Variovorax terrae]
MSLLHAITAPPAGRATLRLLALAALLAGSAPAPAQNQDAAKALNLFQSLIRPGQPAAPAAPQPANAAGALTQMLGGGAAPAAAGQAANAGELIKLLSQSLDQIDEPREIEIGRQLSAVLLGSKPLSPDLPLQRYVNQLGRWISLQSPRPDLPWTFAVLDDPGFNAFAAPGGYVFVTRGLVDRTADEAELAGILAHEITHVTGRHHLKAMNKTARAGLLTQVIGSQVGGGVGGALSSQLLAMGRDLYARGLDQDDEFEADRTAVALAARAGFDPYGLVSVLQQLRSATPDNPLFALSLSTHPPTQLRLDQIELAMGHRLDALSGKPAVTVAQRMEVLAAASRPAAPAAAPARSQPAKKK